MKLADKSSLSNKRTRPKVT